VRAGPEAAEVDLQAATRGAELWEVLVRSGHATAQVGALFDQYNLLAGFSGFKCGCHAADAATDHQDSLVCGYYFRHGLPPLRNDYGFDQQWRLACLVRQGTGIPVGQQPGFQIGNNTLVRS